MTTLSPDLIDGDDWETWALIRERIHAGEMPPEEQPRPKQADLDKVLEWIDTELHNAETVGRFSKPAKLPVGRAIPTEYLFDGKHDEPFSAQPRLWRVSPEIYLEMVSNVGGRDRKGIALPFAAANTKGGFADSDAGQLDEAAVQGLFRNAEAVVAAQTNYRIEDGKLKNLNLKQFEPFINENVDPSDAEIQALIQRQFELVLKRKPNEDELTRYTTLTRKTIATAGPSDGARLAMAAVLLKAEAAFRSEVGTNKPDAQGRVMLEPRELAFALSYALTDNRPDDTLLKAALQGELSTPEAVVAQVERILDSPKIPKTRIMRFFHEYFEYQSAIDVFKDPKHPDKPSGFNAQTLISDTDNLLQLILEEDKNVFEELLTTRRSFVNYGYDSKRKTVSQNRREPLEQIYGIKTWTPKQPVMLPAKERAGILTQPAWLVAHSTSFDNHAILRGKWVREKLLGGEVPDLPITVDAQLPDDPLRTLRDRMSVTREAYCWGCHKQMNDVGLTFEMFDHFGRYRTTEIEKPVDSSGAITLTGTIDQPVDNAVSMIQTLAKTDLARRVFLRHLFRYIMGRDETLGDAPTLRLMDKTYLESGGSFRKTLIVLLSSEPFLYRSSNVKPQSQTGDDNDPSS